MVSFGLERTPNCKLVNISASDGNWVKPKSKKRFWLNKFIEFCKRTDLHGYKYIVMEDFNNLERSCWAVAVVLSIALAVYFVVTAYKWYARNPIVTVIESTQGAIWDVPFPAVTICDLNVVSKKAARELANNLTLPANVTAEFVFKTFRLLPLLHSTYVPEDEEKEHLYQLQDILDYNNITINSLFAKLSPASPCTHLIERCMWKNAIYRCNDLFKQIFTLLSVCCTFNYFAIDDKKENDLAPQLSPRRVASCGYQTALTVLLYTNPDDYYSANVASQGVLVIIDNAYNVPDLDSSVRMVNPSTEVLIALSPERTYATSGIKYFTPEERQCYYSDEVRLQLYRADSLTLLANAMKRLLYEILAVLPQKLKRPLDSCKTHIRIGNFRQYSFHNCMAYQKVKVLEQVCGCAPFFLPSASDYRTCNFKDIDCMQNAVKKQDYLNSNMSERQLNLFKCLPECEHYDYPLEVALGKIADSVFVNGLPFFEGVNLKNRSLLNVFFNDLVSTRYRRDVYLNWQNILAAFGGLLSLMLGFTLISGFDLILFFTIRIVYNSVRSMLQNDIARNKVNVQEYSKKDNWTPPAYDQRIKNSYRKDFYDYGRY